MIKNIQEHHTNEEIEIIKLQNEITRWKSELEFVTKELQFYHDILGSISGSKKIKRPEKNQMLCDQIQKLLIRNEQILKSCRSFHPKLEEMNDCEDMQCDHAFISTSLRLRTEIEKHLTEIRSIKINAFSRLKDSIKI